MFVTTATALFETNAAFTHAGLTTGTEKTYIKVFLSCQACAILVYEEDRKPA